MSIVHKKPDPPCGGEPEQPPAPPKSAPDPSQDPLQKQSSMQPNLTLSFEPLTEDDGEALKQLGGDDYKAAKTFFTESLAAFFPDMVRGSWLYLPDIPRTEEGYVDRERYWDYADQRINFLNAVLDDPDTNPNYDPEYRKTVSRDEEEKECFFYVIEGRERKCYHCWGLDLTVAVRDGKDPGETNALTFTHKGPDGDITTRAKIVLAWGSPIGV